MPRLLNQRDYQDHVDAVLANPADRNQRLVFADYLQEHDDPRAPLLRLTAAAELAASSVPVSRDVPGIAHPYYYDPVDPKHCDYNPTRWLRSWGKVTCSDRNSWTRLLVIALMRDLFRGFDDRYVVGQGNHVLYSGVSRGSHQINQFPNESGAYTLAVWELYSARLITYVSTGGRPQHPLNVVQNSTHRFPYNVVRDGRYRGWYSSIGHMYRLSTLLVRRGLPIRTSQIPDVPHSRYVYGRWRRAVEAFIEKSKDYDPSALSLCERQRSRPPYPMNNPYRQRKGIEYLPWQ